jgi:hypothetical protein
MGMYDYLECATSLPGNPPIAGRWFQTKSLYRVLGRFTITREGRLIFHSLRAEIRPEKGTVPFLTLVPTGDIDLDFHGDIKLTTEEGEIEDYVVRFTHGTLEWVRHFADLSEPEQMLATRRNLEG